MINTIDLHVCTDIIKQEMNEHFFFGIMTSIVQYHSLEQPTGFSIEIM